MFIFRFTHKNLLSVVLNIMLPIFYSTFSLFVVNAERCCAGGRIQGNSIYIKLNEIKC